MISQRRIRIGQHHVRERLPAQLEHHGIVMLAFEQAVSRLPGVTSVSVVPQPNDVATLSLTSSDPTLVAQLLESLPGIQLEIESA